MRKKGRRPVIGVAMLMTAGIALAQFADASARASILQGVGDAITAKGISEKRETRLEELVSERVKSALDNPPFTVHKDMLLPPELISIVSQTLRENPELKVARSQVAIYEQKVAPAGAKMDPMLGVMFMNRMVPRPFSYMEMMTMDQITLRQEFMSYGKRITKRNIAELEVELRRWEIAEAEYKLTGEIFDMYYALLENEVELDQVKKNRELLSALVEIVQGRYELNQVMQSDLLMVQMRYSETYERELMLEEMRKTMLSRLAGMVGVPLSELSLDLNLNGEELTLPAELAPVWETALQRHPENLWLDTRGKQVGLMKKMARKEYHPDYALELSYGYRENYPDMFNLGIMFNLPIYQRQKQDAMFMEALAMEEEVKLMRDALLNRIRTKVQEQAVRLTELKKRLDLFEKVLLPQVRATFDSALASYQVNMDQFAVLLDATLALIDMETDYRIATVNLGRTVALLDYYSLGTIRDLPRLTQPTGELSGATTDTSTKEGSEDAQIPGRSGETQASGSEVHEEAVNRNEEWESIEESSTEGDDNGRR